jgi:hypothetical protein
MMVHDDRWPKVNIAEAVKGFLAGLLGRTWFRVALSNLLIGLAGLLTNLLSSDISSAPQLPWYAYLSNLYAIGLLAVLALNTLMQVVLEPASGFRTKADFRETLRRGVSRELMEEMRRVIRTGEQGFLSAQEVKTLLDIDNG